MKKRIIPLLALLSLAALLLGACRIETTTADPSGAPVNPSTPAGTPADDAEVVANIIWHPWNNLANAQKVMDLKAVRWVRNPVGREHEAGWVEGRLEMDFAGNPWQRNGSGPGDRDGIWLNFFFWNEERKAYEGGKFEWAAKGTVSLPADGTLPVGIKNIQGGYNGLFPPPSGTKVAWMWSRAFSSTERSNLVFGVWP